MGKPSCKLIGTDGNIFALAARTSRALKNAGMKDKADEMYSRIKGAGSYDETVNIIVEYMDAE